MVSYKTKVFGIINIVINLISLFAHVLLLVFSLFTGGLTSLLVEDIASNIGVVGLIVFGVVLVIMVYSIIAVVFIMIYLFLHIKAYSKFSENRISKVLKF